MYAIIENIVSIIWGIVISYEGAVMVYQGRHGYRFSLIILYQKLPKILETIGCHIKFGIA